MQQRGDKKWWQITGVQQTCIKIRLRCIICAVQWIYKEVSGAADLTDQNHQPDPDPTLPRQPGLFTPPVFMHFC